MRKATLKHFIAANAAVFAMVAAPAAIDHFYADFGWMPVANAADDGGGGGKSADRSGGHNRPDGAGGSSKRPDAGATPPAKGKTEAWDPESKPRWMNDGAAGGSTTSSKGGRPVYAKDALVYNGTTAELGRMNVARAPEAVFERQLVEALAALNTDSSLYTLSLAQAIAAITAETAVRIDSPLANLALLKDLLADGKIVVNDSLTLSGSVALQALLVGSASDKTIPITDATVFAVYTILGAVPKTAEGGVDAAAITEIATAAESVRQAVLFAHDN
jgi:hypothetical protein